MKTIEETKPDRLAERLSTCNKHEDLEKAVMLAVRLDPELMCPITKCIFKEPVRVYGKSYEAVAIKEYVLNHGQTPDKIQVNLQAIALQQGFSALFQSDVETKAKVSRYARAQLGIIASLLGTQADFVVQTQTSFVEALVELFDFIRPSQRGKEALSVILWLNQYSELSLGLVDALTTRWGSQAATELTALAEIATAENLLRLYAVTTSRLARFYVSQSDLERAKNCYDGLYIANLADEQDLRSLAALLTHFPEHIGQYEDIDFKKIVLQVGRYTLNREVITTLATDLADSVIDLETKVSHLDLAMQADFKYERAQKLIESLAEDIVKVKECQQYLPMVSRVLVSRQNLPLLSKLYRALQPQSVLDSPNLTELLRSLGQTLLEKGDMQAAVEVLNLLGKQLFVLQQYAPCISVSQRILDDLDAFNLEAFGRLKEASAVVKHDAIPTRYRLNNLLGVLLAQSSHDAQLKTVLEINQLFAQLEANVGDQAKTLE
jgi:hypothetical protein